MDVVDLNQKVFKLMIRSKKIMQRFVEEEQLTTIEYYLLEELWKFSREDKTISMSELAQHFQVSLPAVMHKVDHLLEKRMLSKISSPKDKRTKLLKLSEQAEEAILNIRKKYQDWIDAYLNYLNEDAVYLEAILNKTIAFMEGKDD